MVDAPSPSTGPAKLLETSHARRVVFVVGSGRSGTSTMAGSLQSLGMHVPQPEVLADETNPKGFGEPQWVVDLHDELLNRCNVAVSDARPNAWFDAGRLNNIEPIRKRLHAWLEEQFTEEQHELVVKDPRLAWFLPIWRAAAMRCDARPGYVTMLRPVTEVVGSKQRAHDARANEVNRTAAWVNLMLGCERSTRGEDRAFVRYHDLLDDWTVPVFELGQAFDLDAVKSAAANDIRRVHQYIDPSLRSAPVTWDDLDVPRRLREIAQELWVQLEKLPGGEGDNAETHEALDQIRAAYTDMYDEAAAMSQSTSLAARRAGIREGERNAPRGVDRLPHWVRALFPGWLRRGLRKAAGRERS